MKYLKKLFLSLIIITFFMLIYSILFPNIELDSINIPINSEYTPRYSVYNLFINLDKYSTYEDNVDVNVPGEYTAYVKVKYLFFNIKKKFYINVIDNISPSITLNGDSMVNVCPMCDYIEEGYTASDNYDGDITDKVTIKKIDNSIIYSVKDSSGNTTNVERKINFVDDENPIIKLKGSSNQVIYLGNSYTEAGYEASDNCDGDITDRVIVSGSVDIYTLDTYYIKYEVEDTAGNKSEVVRTVKVINKPNYYGNGIIYLTFDDGPSELTRRVLDILDEEGVKATFFVTHGGDYVKRAYNSEHTIALHTYTHDYGYIYSSVNNYFTDLNNVSNSVYNSIGIRPLIIRFPGGSSNTVSKHYSTGIMSILTQEVLNRGYSYYDWNIDSNDAGSDIYNSNKIYYNVINNLSHNKTNIVLMHDSASHSASVNALRDIIRYGKGNGYTFKAITSDTPVIRHSVNN